MSDATLSIPPSHHHDYVVDASGFKGWADAVFVPPDEAAIVAIIQRAARERVPITVVGARSGLTGGGVAQGGWVLSLEKFNAVQISQGYARAGAAVTLL